MLRQALCPLVFTIMSRSSGQRLLLPPQIEKERAGDIERDNTTLVRKMQRIMSTEGSVDHRNAYRHHR